jgi:hypothetical protein
MDEATIAATLDAKGFPRVTKESIEEKIKDVQYMSPLVMGGAMTICFITMKNGWVSHGVSATASIGNFDEEIGKHYAYENAFRPLWQLEGYLLREKLSAE